MKIALVDAAFLLCNDLPFTLEVGVKENAEAIIRSHLEWLKENYSSVNSYDPNKHKCLVAYSESDRVIVAYRYFHFVPGANDCHLLATFVAPAYRSQGIAKNLFLKAVEVGCDEGCTHFNIHFDSATEERKGLAEYYKRYADKQLNLLTITINYGGESLKYPRTIFYPNRSFWGIYVAKLKAFVRGNII